MESNQGRDFRDWAGNVTVWDLSFDNISNHLGYTTMLI